MAILDRIKFDGLASRDWIIYKYYRDDIRLGSQLIVGEGQAAIFVKGGKVCDVFGPGTYTLSTQNLPLIGGLVTLPFGGQTPFTAELYFVNTATRLDIAWGTSDPIPLIDPKFHVHLRVRAFGQLGLKINDYALFFTQLIGSIAGADLVRYDKVINFFKGMLISKAKSSIAEVIIQDGISALEISAKLDDISERIHQELVPDFAAFGFHIVNFFIKSINFPQEDFDKISSLLEDKAAFDIMGDARYVTKRTFDVYESAANNENGVAGAFVAGGLGLGAGIQMAQSAVPMPTEPDKTVLTCPQCHAENPSSAKFCKSCGHALTPPPAVCAFCGAQLPADSRFCIECGKPQDARVCSCGAQLQPDTKFCSHCGKRVDS